MAALDVEKLLAETSPDAPAGENLEYDPAFGALERASQGKPEQQFGDTVIPGEPPDWKSVREAALELFPRTKDLRVAMYLVAAELRVGGLRGFRDALKVLDGLLARYWETLHPALDPEDDNDPTMRVNVVATLNDAQRILRGIREVPLVASRMFGRISLKDVQIAAGLMTAPEGQETPDSASVDGAFMEVDLEELSATADAVREGIDLARSIEDQVTRFVGASRAVDLSPVREVLKEVSAALNERLARRGVVAGGAAAEQANGGDAAGGGAVARISGEITSREDVIRMIEKACEYFARHEPGSPVPLVLERAKRLIGKNFLEVLRDLAPDGMGQARIVAGIEE